LDRWLAAFSLTPFHVSSYLLDIPLAEILAPINWRQITPSGTYMFGEFVARIYLAFYRRKSRHSTVTTNEYRIWFHLTSKSSARTLGSFSRLELQNLLDRKVSAELSFSTVAHLRWDLNQIFTMAVAEDFLLKNPATLIFTPREARPPMNRSMTIEEVKTFFSVLDVRECVIAGLAIIAGMRPGEIFGLIRGRLEAEYADIHQRVYRGVIDSPKTANSKRRAVL